MGDVWLIGQAPSSDGATNFRGRSGRSLATWAKVPYDLFPRVFKTLNLLNYYPGRKPGGKGDVFPKKEAEEAAQRLIDNHIEVGDHVVCIGKDVAHAFGVDTKKLPPAEWTINRDITSFAWIPHPSGINRWYNEVENVNKVRDFLYRTARGLDEGPQPPESES